MELFAWACASHVIAGQSEPMVPATSLLKALSCPRARLATPLKDHHRIRRARRGPPRSSRGKMDARQRAPTLLTAVSWHVVESGSARRLPTPSERGLASHGHGECVFGAAGPLPAVSVVSGLTKAHDLALWLADRNHRPPGLRGIFTARWCRFPSSPRRAYGAVAAFLPRTVRALTARTRHRGASRLRQLAFNLFKQNS